MELGLELDDDSLFETKPDKNKVDACRSHNLKNHFPLWFYDSQDSTDECNILKCKADHNYSIGNYDDALRYFMLCQDLIPGKFNVVWRDLEEAKARCYVRLHRPQEALNCALSLVKLAGSFDQATANLHLLQTVYSEMSNLYEEERVLKKLLMLHPLNVTFWIRLGKLYIKQSIPVPGADVESSLTGVSEHDVDSSGFHRIPHDCVVGGCVDSSFPESQSSSSAGCDSLCELATSLSRVSSGSAEQLETNVSLETSDSKTSELSSSSTEYHLRFENVKLELAKALICLLTARRLLKRNRNAQTLQRGLNEKLQNEVQKELDFINAPQTVLQFVESTLSHSDVESSKETDDMKPTEALPIGLLDDGSDVIDAFDIRWFSQLSHQQQQHLHHTCNYS